MAIAATVQLRPGRNGWQVPSQSGAGTYTVDPEMGECNCPDHETRQVECKHLLAVRFTIRRERGKSGAVKYTREVQVTYSQEWSAYNAAQWEEKGRFLELLADLTRTLPAPERSSGRPPMPMATMAFATTYKVYGRLSSRRFTTDIRDAHARGLIERV